MPGPPNPFTRSTDAKPDPDALAERDRRRLAWLEAAARDPNILVLGDPVPQRSALAVKAVPDDRPRKGPAKVPSARYG